MSRRHASISAVPMKRAVTAALVALFAVAAFLPAAAAAQRNDEVTPKQIQWEWQLLTQVDDRGVMEDVPSGVGATLLLRSEAASGEAACSTYDSSYNNRANVMNIFVQDEEIEWRECDSESRQFDETFYANLGNVASISRADDVLVLRDVIGENLMVFTRATIDNDPTAARWSLARIGDADGSVTQVIRGIFPWMEFLRGGSLVGSTGCGSFLGKWATNEGRIDITDVDYRLTDCQGGARPQAERILATLDEISDFQVRPAGLALEDERGTIRLALTPDLELAKRTWTPTALYNETGKQQYGSGNELTTSAVKFIGGAYEGRSICRPFKGNIVRSGLAISVGRPTFIGDASACRGKLPDGTQLDQIEEGFITALESAASYALRGDELAITDVNGVIRAVLEPQPPLTGNTWVVFKMRQGKKLVEPSGDVPITATFEEVDASNVGVVQGKTGVSNELDENEYFGTFKTRQATVIDVIQLQRTGKGCRGTYAKTKACLQQETFLKLLESADGYIARDEDLKFYKGRQNIIVFRRELFDASDE